MLYRARHFALLLCTVLLVSASHAEWTLSVTAGKHDRLATPMVAELPKELHKIDGFVLKSGSEKPLIAQRIGSRLHWIQRGLKAGTSREYRIVTSTNPAKTDKAITVAESDGDLQWRIGKRALLSYQVATNKSPSGIDSAYARSGYVHPILTPKGVAVTDDFPPDHPHQHAMFFAWVNTSLGEEKKIDFWNQKGNTGRIEHARTAYTAGGPVTGLAVTTLNHLDITQKKPQTVLTETWLLKAYSLDAVTMMDITSVQALESDQPLRINKYHYGGMAFRGHRAWYGDGKQPPGVFETNQGKHRKDGNHSRPNWVSLSGPTPKGRAGMVVMGHPENFRFPQHVRLHPSKPYFCFSPMVDKAFEINKTGPYQSRYRLIAHDGPLDKKLINRLWADYAEPATAVIEPADQ